jgi:hypothetical protein
MGRRGLIAIFLILTLLITGLVAARGGLQPIQVELPARLMPGQPVPTDARCDWEHYWGSEYRYCQSGAAYLTVKQGTIDRVTFDVHVAVGDLILAWGQPTGAEIYSYSTYVYWGTRQAWVWGQFGPSARVWFVTFSAKPDQVGPWQGFKTG